MGRQRSHVNVFLLGLILLCGGKLSWTPIVLVLQPPLLAPSLHWCAATPLSQLLLIQLSNVRPEHLAGPCFHRQSSADPSD